MKTKLRAETNNLIKKWIKEQYGTAGWEMKLKNLVAQVEANAREKSLKIVQITPETFKVEVDGELVEVKKGISNFKKEVIKALLEEQNQ